MPEKKESAATPPSGGESGQQTTMQLHIDPNLEYAYRDLFNVFIGAEDVVIEFGNRHRSVPNRGSVLNRIVLSVPNAFRLQQMLGQGLRNAQERIREQAAKQQQAKADDA